MSNDLATQHAPITDLFTQPTSPEDWTCFQLSEDQIRHFQEQGYVSGVRLLDDTQIEALRDQRTVEGADSGVPLSIKTGEKA